MKKGKATLSGQHDYYPDWEKLVDKNGGTMSAPHLAREAKAQNLYDPSWVTADPIYAAILPRVEAFFNEKFPNSHLAKFTQLVKTDKSGHDVYKRSRQLTLGEWQPAIRRAIRTKVTAQLLPVVASYADGYGRGYRLPPRDVPRWFQVAYKMFVAGELPKP